MVTCVKKHAVNTVLERIIPVIISTDLVTLVVTQATKVPCVQKV